MTNPAPEPGQRVWIEAEVVRNALGDLMFAPLTPDGSVSKSIRFAPTNYRWHPADVPPQPPVLAPGSTVLLAGRERDPRPWAVLGWWHSPGERESIRVRLVPAPASTLADERSPDGATPTPEPDEAQTGAQGACPDCGGSGFETGLDGTGDDPPLAGKGAALIAATEQKIAANANCSPLAYAHLRAEAWEPTARRLADPLDSQTTPKPASDRIRNLARQIERERGQDWITDRLYGLADDLSEDQPKPAAQGAGRDWRGEIVAVLAPEIRAYSQEQPVLSTEHIADRIVAALGLHDLEQAAATREKRFAELNEWAGFQARARDGWEERARNAERQRNECAEVLAGVALERDAARRELEQLRGEVGKIADDWHDMAQGLTDASEIGMIYRGGAAGLRAALAATAPATQDGADRA